MGIRRKMSVMLRAPASHSTHTAVHHDLDAVGLCITIPVKWNFIGHIDDVATLPPFGWNHMKISPVKVKASHIQGQGHQYPLRIWNGSLKFFDNMLYV